MFATGQNVLGRTPLKEIISVEFTTIDIDEFPSAGTCSSTLILPTAHKFFNVFAEKMDKAFELELVGFSEA